MNKRDMDKEDLKQMGDKSDFIRGIYNYCDRWCERCPFISKCFLFATEKSQFSDAEPKDVDNQKFWDEMEDILKLTYGLLEDTAEEMGIDLNQIEAEEIYQDEKEKRKQAKNHPAVKTARNYISEVNNWFDNYEYLLNQKSSEFSALAKLDALNHETSDRAAELSDFIEVIRWYQHQISAKIIRALQGKLDDFSLAEDPIQNDYNGSAKVALINIDRSIAAWGGLLKVFPENEDEMLPILVLLEKTRTHMENEFPSARKFQRPGFDD